MNLNRTQIIILAIIVLALTSLVVLSVAPTILTTPTFTATLFMTVPIIDTPISTGTSLSTSILPSASTSTVPSTESIRSTNTLTLSFSNTLIPSTAFTPNLTATSWSTPTPQGRQFIINGTARYAVFSPNGKYVLSSDVIADGEGITYTVYLLDITNLSKPICQMPTTQGTPYLSAFNSLGFSPDSKYAVTGNTDGSMIFWTIDMSSPQCGTTTAITLPTGSHAIESTVFSPDGNFILIGSADGVARIWDRTAKIFTVYFGAVTDKPVNSVAFSPDKQYQYVLTGDAGENVQLWDTFNGSPAKKFFGPTDQVNSVAFSPNGKYILAGSKDKTVWVWDTNNGLSQCGFHLSDEITSATFSSDGTYILAASRDGTVHLLKINPCKEVGSPIQVTNSPIPSHVITSIAISPDGGYFLTTASNVTQLWDSPQP